MKTNLTRKEYLSLVSLSNKLWRLRYTVKDYPLRDNPNVTFQDQISVALAAIETILQDY